MNSNKDQQTFKRFNLRDDDFILAYANAHVARVIPSTGYNKTNDCNVNLQ